MAFDIVFTEDGQNDYDECLDYISSNLKNPLAAQHLHAEIIHTLARIADAATSYPLCENAKLAERGLRKIHLKKYKYKIFYSIDGETVYVEAILHDKRDFDSLLM